MVHVWTNVIEAKGVAKAYGDKLLYDNLNFTLPQAGIVGIIPTVLVNRLFSE
jgi:ABC-type transporter Mla maintaining outer membrane lipid asymmetry ATPase subunit MlaF